MAKFCSRKKERVLLLLLFKNDTVADNVKENYLYILCKVLKICSSHLYGAAGLCRKTILDYSMAWTEYLWILVNAHKQILPPTPKPLSSFPENNFCNFLRQFVFALLS
jgi:hypothetical protein